MQEKITGFEASLKVEQTWPPSLVNVKGFKKVEFPVSIIYEEFKTETTQSPLPADKVQTV